MKIYTGDAGTAGNLTTDAHIAFGNPMSEEQVAALVDVVVAEGEPSDATIALKPWSNKLTREQQHRLVETVVGHKIE